MSASAFDSVTLWKNGISRRATISYLHSYCSGRLVKQHLAELVFFLLSTAQIQVDTWWHFYAHCSLRTCSLGDVWQGCNRRVYWWQRWVTTREGKCQMWYSFFCMGCDTMGNLMTHCVEICFSRWMPSIHILSWSNGGYIVVLKL